MWTKSGQMCLVATDIVRPTIVEQVELSFVLFVKHGSIIQFVAGGHNKPSLIKAFSWKNTVKDVHT